MVHPRVSADRSNSFGTNNLPKRSTSKGSIPISAPPSQKASPSRKVVSRPLAREPRIDAESTRDFADFIRSTGPQPGQDKPPQPFVNISGNAQPANGSSPSLGRATSIKQNGPRNLESPYPKSRINMEPRSPAGLSGGNNDLIDFIRQGPPNGNNQPRIPRNVAPFRTTVDSDQFDTMLGAHGNVESAYGSTVSTLDSKQSQQTINSRTGLIPEPKVVQPAYSNTPQNLSGNMTSGNEPMVTKTRRRIKDPYAIDFSDEEDDDEEEEDEDQLTALPHTKPPPAPKQESLMDFLNGNEPLVNSQPQPFILSQSTIAAAKARANANSSPLSTQNPLLRNGSSLSGNTSMNITSNAPRAYKPRMQARTPSMDEPPRGSRTGTSDLADFLRDSAPPEPIKPSPMTARKDEEKKSRRFWRSKKSYGDMP